LQEVQLVDLAEEGDPGPIWFAFLPGIEAFKLLYSEPKAKGHFYTEPEPKYDGVRVVKGKEVPNRVYGEPRRGIWWEKAHQRVSILEFSIDLSSQAPCLLYRRPYFPLPNLAFRGKGLLLGRLGASADLVQHYSDKISFLW
jgi:hypothetical protein